MNEQQLQTILSEAYGIHAPPPDFLRDGGGQTYLVNGNPKCLLKVIGPAFSETARQSVAIMRYLAERGFPVPRILLTKQGHAVLETSVDGVKSLLVLMEYLDGDEPDLEQDAAKIGALIGRFHRLMAQCPIRPVPRGKDFFIGRYLAFLRQKHDPNLAAYEKLGARLWEKVETLPQGTCHGDLHRGNLLQSPDGTVYLLDFDTVCRAPRMFDLAVLCDLTDYFRLDPADVRTARRVYRKFLTGYAQDHALSPAEILSFPDWVAIRHFQLQATILELYGVDCIDAKFVADQLAWLRQWQEETAAWQN